jgi:hypothetical protein
MATALDVINLEDAKEYLVVDFTDRDNEIIRFIKTAVSYVENYTNIMLYQRQKKYTLINGCLEIYDSPIGFLTTSIKTHQNILSVTVSGTLNQEVTALVGFVSSNDIPGEIIDACYKLILYLFENKDIYMAELPWDIQMMLNLHRRSATI